MEQPLSVLVVLILVSFCKGIEWMAPEFCHEKQCPQYKLVDTNKDFEERLYIATDWITTKVDGTDQSDLLAAHMRLKDYCRRQKVSGYEISIDTWPTLITVTEGEDGRGISLSWFVPPGTIKPESTDPLVILQSRREATVYVRVFGGTPTVKDNQDNKKMLCEALDKAGKTFDPNTYTGAYYESYFSLNHHNEIWIYAA